MKNIETNRKATVGAAVGGAGGRLALCVRGENADAVCDVSCYGTEQDACQLHFYGCCGNNAVSEIGVQGKNRHACSGQREW